MHRVSEIKLIRTDTTLDLSQKAEKVWSVGELLGAEMLGRLVLNRDCGHLL